MQVIMHENSHFTSLVSRAQGGDREAFDALVAQSGERLERFVCARLRPELRRQLPTAELVQEVFARAFESLRRFQGEDEDAWFAWLSGIARNVVLKSVARRQRAPSLQLLREPTNHEPSPSRDARQQERLERLHGALRALPDDYQEVIQLCRIDGLKIREAAERMERSPDAVKKLLWRALKELKKYFGDTESLTLPRRHPEEGGDRDV